MTMHFKNTNLVSSCELKDNVQTMLDWCIGEYTWVSIIDIKELNL